MGHLIYAIDQHLEFIDFGRVVISTMLKYVDGVVVESRVLPYLALITKLLEVNKITHREYEDMVLLKRHTRGKSLRNMPSDFVQPKLS